ncbi:uncharacterized protein (DUF885 family) [Sphingomonas naasensis]|uniref:DUF885 domain-containing protein n=1 Tax=Sphingomonas naasensis TaxID=1344951 RepID=A0A4S1WLX2_9SPHN|nr:DUF885 domain-containing protein [Sphingomonas naasensis]NIJ20143.1 uncharacterized protein (DUF885 family) [Sphingomonas naasensis]TGX44294.1 DUF885 domain-containing protein [Sphingomonas naasensis]
MRSSRRQLLLGTAGTLAAAALPRSAHALFQNADARADALLTRTAESFLKLYPENATSLGIDKEQRAPLKHQLTDRSPAGQRKIVAHLRETLGAIGKLDMNALSPVMRTNVEVVQASYGSGLEGFGFGYGDVAVGSWRNTPYAVVQNVGAWIDVPRMLDTDHQVNTREDAEAYVDRVESYAEQLDGETQRLKTAAAKGVIAPDFLLDKALRQLKIARSGNTAGWGLVTSIANRTAGMEGDFGNAAWMLANDKVAPALDRQIAELERHRKRATSDAGVWKFADGEAYYAWALRAGTTTTMTPDEVHQMGLDQLRAIQAEMDAILRKEGYSQGSVGARMEALAKDPRFAFAEGDPGRAEILQFLNTRIADIRGRMPQAFNTLVKGNVEVRRLPPEEEPGAPGAYGGPGSIDGTIPGKFWINLRTTSLHTRFSLPDLAYHEAIPGHVWQGEYAFKLPLMRSLLQFNAYSEGWALYAEQLADELGVYADNPAEKLGYLQSLGFRACRLVVDTGLHAKRWTRQQAIDWFVTANGSSVEEVSGEVDRYCAWPGQACGYKVGHSEINRLRDRAKTALGPAYDFKAFNDAVVLGGNVPMTVLGHVVDRHIAARKA